MIRLPPVQPLHPVQAYKHHLRSALPPGSILPASLPESFDGDIKHIMYAGLGRSLCCVLDSAGLDPPKYSTHSLRSGGASYAFKCGAPVEVISLQEDWSSDVVLPYIAQPLKRRLSVARLIASTLHASPLKYFFVTFTRL